MILDANEILPRLWIGTCASCDAARAQGYRAICVLEQSHTSDARCQHQCVLGDDGKIKREWLYPVIYLIDELYKERQRLLVHCGAGVERSPLVVAMWMTSSLGLTLDEAYAWLKLHRPQIEDRRQWLP